MNECYIVAAFCAGIICGMIVMALEKKPEPTPEPPRRPEPSGHLGTKLDVWA
jgi:hypothetical protein